MNAIEIKNLTKVFKDGRNKQRVAVDNLSLSVEEGEIYALLGVNGAGKSTTVKMLCTLTSPTSGDALLLGHSILTEQNEVKKIINVSPQETAIAPNLTVKENLQLNAVLYGMSNADAAIKAKQMMDEFGLSDRANDRGKKLSGGYQRRLSIAMALISDPKILFLDEPTLGLDVRARRELWKIINSLKGRATVILTTHYLEEAAKLSDRIAIMHEGKLCACGTLDQLKEQTGKDNIDDIFLALTDEEGQNE